jgi:hypothetical protein
MACRGGKVNPNSNWPAKIISYNRVNRTVQVQIAGLTDGSSNGLPAKIAYPIGENDRDTERQILANADVWVFFEGGDLSLPVVWAYRSHGNGALVGTRRIKQENIELIATEKVKLSVAGSMIEIDGEMIKLSVAGSMIEIVGEMITITSPQATFNTNLASFSALVNIMGLLSVNTDVAVNLISLLLHKHGYTDNGIALITSPPIP